MITKEMMEELNQIGESIKDLRSRIIQLENTLIDSDFGDIEDLGKKEE